MTEKSQDGKSITPWTGFWLSRAPARLKFSLATAIGNVTNFTFFFSHGGHFWACFVVIFTNFVPFCTVANPSGSPGYDTT
jgi:hypothetical protein